MVPLWRKLVNYSRKKLIQVHYLPESNRKGNLFRQERTGVRYTAVRGESNLDSYIVNEEDIDQTRVKERGKFVKVFDQSLS